MQKEVGEHLPSSLEQREGSYSSNLVVSDGTDADSTGPVFHSKSKLTHQNMKAATTQSPI